MQKDIYSQTRDIIVKYYKDKIPTAYIHSFGCQQNINDGEKIKGVIQSCGFSISTQEETADLIIYNTCAVREHAQDRVYGNIGNLKHLKEKNKSLLIGICGCMTEQQITKDKIKKSFPHVNFAIGTNAINTIPEIIKYNLEKEKRYFSKDSLSIEIDESIPINRDSKIKAWVPIMYGCDNFCSYCIVPYVRGRERSRKSQDIIKEVKNLIENGYKEITLLGQNVNSYGKGLEQDIDFADLLDEICKIDGDFWIRFMTSHPKDATKKLIDVIAKNEKICKHLHLPVQSGSNKILKMMNRKYTNEQYCNLIDYAKEKIPSLSITSDIIVGFPNETENDFFETLELIKKVKYCQLFTFIYSKRNGTKAAEIEDNTPYSEKAKHMKTLLDTQCDIGEKYNQSLIGSIQKVLVDGKGKSFDNFLTSRTSSNIICEFEGDEGLVGKFINVKITSAKNWAVFGEILK